MKKQHKTAPCRWPMLCGHVMAFKILFTAGAVGIPFRCFSQVKEFPGRLPPSVWGVFFFVLGDTQAHHRAFDFRRNILQKVAHTSSVLGRVTSSTGLFGEVTGRNARSITGLEKSGKILCCRANLQVKMMSVK